jgi:uncharacterized protein (UPF0305 family)
MEDKFKILTDTMVSIAEEMQQIVKEEMGKIDQITDPAKKEFIQKTYERINKAKENQDSNELSQIIKDINANLF